MENEIMYKKNIVKRIEVFDDKIILSDGTIIKSYHYQDCCEETYADFKQLKDTTFEDEVITKQNLKLEAVEGYGFRINGYSVPCYSIQNGYYSSVIAILVDGTTSLLFNAKLVIRY